MAGTINYKLSVVFIREGKRYIAHSPALDLSTSGRSFAQAKKRFEEAASLFFEEIMSKGTVANVLSGLGWTKQRKIWQPPVIISQHIETIIPVAV
ncbi:MAG: hypothetical protein AAB691_02605 [Patescibacteria group bacterium]